MTERKWTYTTLILLFLSLALFALFNRIIDPFFHYGIGLPFMQYPLNDERYVNDGIQRHYDYEIMITGTSESCNFNPSYFEELSGKKTIKTVYVGSTFHDLCGSIQNAIDHNPNLSTVICSFDISLINYDAYEESFSDPRTYLSDNNSFNDINYLLNKDVFLRSVNAINYTRAGNTTPSMDEYSRFDTYLSSGKEAVFSRYDRAELIDETPVFFGDEERSTISQNLTVNFIKLANNNPDVEFILYIPPYSYLYWDGLIRTNQLSFTIEVEKYAASVLFEAENIKLFGFDDIVEIDDLAYYVDFIHYTGEVCDQMTECIFSDKGRLTKENYQEYFDKMEIQYSNYDYDF